LGVSGERDWMIASEAAPGMLGTEAVKWNFTKFLVNRKGEVVRRYGSADGVTKIEPKVVACLNSDR